MWSNSGWLLRLNVRMGIDRHSRSWGEDESDPKQGLLSYVSPLARELFGKGLGEVIATPQGEAEVAEIRATSE